jgi:hypothetical protein
LIDAGSNAAAAESTALDDDEGDADDDADEDELLDELAVLDLLLLLHAAVAIAHVARMATSWGARPNRRAIEGGWKGFSVTLASP